MNPDEPNPPASETLSSSEVAKLMAAVANPQPADAVAPLAGQDGDAPGQGVQPCDFRNPVPLASYELRKLRLLQNEFITSLAARLSLYLRLEVSLKLAGLQTLVYQKLARSWSNPTHLTLFKIEPLRGLSILEIPAPLGSSIVDRLMGGPGRPSASLQEMSDIEKALLEQVVQMVIDEWCSHWSASRELRPVLLGYESNGRFVQASLPETLMLVLTIETRIGECTELMQLSLPFFPLQPLIQKLSRGSDTTAGQGAQPAAVSAPRWNPCLDDVRLPVTAELQGVELAARDVLALKVGDVLQLGPQDLQQAGVRLAGILKFNGRPGTVAGKWAIELTKVIKD